MFNGILGSEDEFRHVLGLQDHYAIDSLGYQIECPNESSSSAKSSSSFVESSCSAIASSSSEEVEEPEKILILELAKNFGAGLELQGRLLKVALGG